MPASLKSHTSPKLQTTTVSANPYAKKIATICMMHGIPSGAGGNLGTFMRALDVDKLLAMNFWSLVVKITDQISAQENGSNQALLEAISEGVTGLSVAELEAGGGEPKWLIQQMAAMLAGEDIQIPAATVAQATAVVPAAALDSTVSREIATVAVEEPALILTPPVTETPVAVEIQLQPFLIRNDSDKSEKSDRSRMVLEPEAAGSRAQLGERALFGSEGQEEKAQAIRVPLQGYGERSASGNVRMIAFATLMALALGSGAFIARGEGAALRQKFVPVVRAGYDSAWHGVKALGNWASKIAE
jgi:hypothetical protein